jgi:hypothetical protein
LKKQASCVLGAKNRRLAASTTSYAGSTLLYLAAASGHN